MTTPLPPEREGSTRRRRAGEGLSPARGPKDNGYDRLPTERSRALRNNPTDAEKRLWSVLRNRQLGGVRFNRQVPIGPYICDFVARTARLIVEADGGQHAVDAYRDEARSRFLQSQGYRVIRFWNNDVLGNIEGVVETISQAVNDRPSPNPSRKREGSIPPSRPVGGEEGRSPEGEGLSSSEMTRPPPLAPGKSNPPAPAGGVE